jgi:hypothetical protein
MAFCLPLLVDLPGPYTMLSHFGVTTPGRAPDHPGRYEVMVECDPQDYYDARQAASWFPPFLISFA